MLTKGQIQTAVVALAAFAVVAFVQRNVFEIPVVGQYMPK